MIFKRGYFLSPMPYKKLGLKCGLEIHQQLEGRKLFCFCPTRVRDDEPHFTIMRTLRAAAGEGGKVDIAAAVERQKDKTFVYQGYKDTTCLVEADAEPPHALNSEALYTVLQFSTLVKAQISSVIQVMRKTIVDGSATSGFQRTALIARKGKLFCDGKEILVESICLEEDACKIVSEKESEKVYRLDRLGIPLIEVSTAPDIASPKECQDVAKKIGLLLRSLPGVKRGLGTIRQDVNVSIAGGTRVEIKGAQDLHLLPVLVELEAKRQEELLKIQEELKHVRRGKLNIVDVTSIFTCSSSKVIQKTMERKGKVLGILLPGFKGYVGRELQPGYRLGTEFSWRAKILVGVGGIFHSDELPNYGITAEEVLSVQKMLSCTEKDAFVLIADEEKKAGRGLIAVYQRAQEVFMGVPKEVRKANADGTTSFLRPMPGAARMYPETDVPLIKVGKMKINLPETLEEKMLRYQNELGLSKDLAEFVAKSEKMRLFEELVAMYTQFKPAFIAATLVSVPLEIKRNYNTDADMLTEDNFKELFSFLEAGKIHKDIVLDVLIDMAKGHFRLEKYASLSTEELHKIILEVICKNKGAPFSALMGLCVKQCAGRASGKMISETLKILLEKGHE